ncbi:LacI family DNA-binding transcriptional regulator [Pseudonocardia acaciae]|uniref:LacI family DNA-binding transcriptional regulator n=1 Tax=Pseudonocardia acaciae TaxID=551276 RepID=UPI00068742AD|nr:LacI family DNA-binding transcriptional regulator [Pseudonocardia acaciae]
MSTLREVAEAASVSVATASRVLNGSDHPVSATVRQAVQAAAERLGYAPSAAAQALKHRRARIIGVIVSDVLDPYFAEVARGIEVEAARHGHVTVLANANRDAEEEREKFQVLREHRASGIVFCGSDIDGSPGTARLAKEVNFAVREGTRVVTLAPRGFDATKIIVDNELAGYEVTRHLLALGHREVTCLGRIPGLTATERRIAGYRRALGESGLGAAVAETDGLSQESGKAAMSRLIESGGLPDAVVCVNDEVAVGALAALWEHRLRAPDDVSIAGIGGTRAAAIFGLTAVTLPLAELGGLAARYIATEATTAPAPPPAVLTPGRTAAARAH